MPHCLRDVVVHAHDALVRRKSFPSKTTVQETERRDEAREETRMYCENCSRTPKPRDLSEPADIRPASSIVAVRVQVEQRGRVELLPQAVEEPQSAPITYVLVAERGIAADVDHLDACAFSAQQSGQLQHVHGLAGEWRRIEPPENDS